MKTLASAERRSTSTAGRRPGNGSGPRLLVVDDSADMRRIIRSALGPLYDVLEAGSGEEALRIAREEKPRVVLLDMGMPDMDGLAVLRGLRERDPEIGVVMITGDVRMDMARSALQGGARSYITKPFDPEALCGEVGRLLECAVARSAGPSDLPWRVVGIGGRR